MTYHVETEVRAVKQIQKIGDRQTQRRVFDAIKALAAEPRPHGCTKLTGMSDTWRVRVGNYRIIYTVSDSVRVVVVTSVGHRRDVY